MTNGFPISKDRKRKSVDRVPGRLPCRVVFGVRKRFLTKVFIAILVFLTLLSISIITSLTTSDTRLHWHLEHFNDRDYTLHVFQYGLSPLDYNLAASPLCIDQQTSKLVTFRGKSSCSGATIKGRPATCEKVLSNARYANTGFSFDERISRKNTWLRREKKRISWVNGVTVLQRVQAFGGNVAHFANKALILHHLLENMQVYTGNPNSQANVLILLDPKLRHCLDTPHQCNSYHYDLLSAVLNGRKIVMSDLHSFITSANLKQTAHLLTNMNGTDEVVCFEKAIIPGSLRNRFFLSDFEYPSFSYQSVNFFVPRDRMKLDRKLDAYFSFNPITRPSKRLVLLNRRDRFRTFSPRTHLSIVNLLSSIAADSAWTFDVIDFHNISFKDQYRQMRDVKVAVGIHGANLVNAMFLPVGSALVELFPYAFDHAMYARAGNAGVYYSKHMFLTSTLGPFKDVSKYSSVAKCIQFNNDCKTHYRDADLSSTASDLAIIERLVRNHIEKGS